MDHRLDRDDSPQRLRQLLSIRRQVKLALRAFAQLLQRCHALISQSDSDEIKIDLDILIGLCAQALDDLFDIIDVPAAAIRIAGDDDDALELAPEAFVIEVPDGLQQCLNEISLAVRAERL